MKTEREIKRERGWGERERWKDGEGERERERERQRERERERERERASDREKEVGKRWEGEWEKKGKGVREREREWGEQGRPQDLAGGGPRIFFSDLEICMSRSDMLRMAKPCALLGGFGGMPPREIFLKWCNLVRFGVYFDQILYLKNLKNYHFLYKNCNFFI